MNRGGMVRDTTQESKAEPPNNITTIQKNTHYKELRITMKITRTNLMNTRNNIIQKIKTNIYKTIKQEWYLKNQDTHNLKCKEIIMCECGIEACRGYLQRHIQTEKHKIY